MKPAQCQPLEAIHLLTVLVERRSGLCTPSPFERKDHKEKDRRKETFLPSHCHA